MPNESNRNDGGQVNLSGCIANPLKPNRFDDREDLEQTMPGNIALHYNNQLPQSTLKSGMRLFS